MTPLLFSSAQYGIAHEEALFAAGQPAVILWRAQEVGLVVPKGWMRYSGFANIANDMAAQGLSLALRPSGGGAVPQGPDILNLAMIAPMRSGFFIEDGYAAICDVIADALGTFNITTSRGMVDGAFCNGRWNVTVAGRKLAGTAQRWRHDGDCKLALLHAALLLQYPCERLWAALEHMQRCAEPSFNLQRDAHTTIGQQLGARMDVLSICYALARSAGRCVKSMYKQDCNGY